MSHHLEPHKIGPSDYFQAFRSANRLLLRYPLPWLCTIGAFGLIMTPAAKAYLMLAIFPFLLSVCFFAAMAVVEELETRSEVSFDGLISGMKQMQNHLCWATAISSVWAGAMIVWGRDLSLAAGVPQLVGLSAEHMPEGAIFSNPAKGVGVGVMVLLFLMTCSAMQHKALLRLRHNLNADQVLHAIVKAHSKNPVSMCICEIAACMIVVMPVITGLWWTAIYTVPMFAAFGYFANKAMFDGNGKLEPHKPFAVKAIN